VGATLRDAVTLVGDESGERVGVGRNVDGDGAAAIGSGEGVGDEVVDDEAEQTAAVAVERAEESNADVKADALFGGGRGVAAADDSASSPAVSS